MRLSKPIGCVFLVFLIAAAAGCSSKADRGGVIARVNGEPIYLADLQREVSIRVRQNPSIEVDSKTLMDIADTLIKRQIMIQGATEKKMAEDPYFVETIKHFWEQTLIRDFIKYKHEQARRYVFVTDKDAEEYYHELKKAGADMPPLDESRERIRGLVEQRKLALELEAWLDGERKSADIEINKGLILKQGS
jgi:hypothetical protein